MDRLVKKGELPGFARMMEEGAHGDLMNPGPQVSPVVWTTFATGHFSRDHGILDFVQPYSDVSGKQPVDVSFRRKPALWNVLDAHGLESTVVGYFVSWPAEPIDGHVVSDRAFNGLENSVWPADLESVSKRVRQAVHADRSELLSRFLPWPYDPAQADDETSPYHEAARIVRGRIDQRILADEYVRRMTEQLMEDPVDLLVSYYRIPDIVSHSAWYYYDDSDWDEAPDQGTSELLGDVVQESYRYVDEVIEMMLDRYGEEANIVVISDHGFGSATGPYATNNPLLTGNHRPNGVILAYGPDVKPGRIEPMTIMEIFPTLANLLDVPIADTVPGSVNYDLLREPFLERQPPRFVERYDFDWQGVEPVKVDQATQAEEMESLRGLGYVGEGVTVGDGAGASGYDFWGVSERLLVANLHAEVVYHLIRGDIAAADEVVYALERNRPEMKSLLLARSQAKVEALRRELGDDESIAPQLAAFLKAHRRGGGEPDTNDE
ncbi:MAG: alkaline phosphatase family protein [Xanthomonadales bacterium]|nr:alkaline phosphatase family protein [Xanthomonadales bacterium]